MRYFAIHEVIYAARLAGGQDGWDEGSYDEHALRAAMQVWSSKSQALSPGARVLELGCGTGALSLQLAATGCVVTGIDISSSAIARAQSIAASRGVEVEFVSASALDWLRDTRRFDVIIDAHMLHCIATADDRSLLLNGIHGALTEDGELWTESMLRPTQVVLGDGQRIDDSGIVWVRNPSAAHSPDAVRFQEELWLPGRYLAPSAAALATELCAAGLQEIEY
jgi:cyclopropane fatty-acyl-phospholipid synthase-like methyltransferase